MQIESSTSIIHEEEDATTSNHIVWKEDRNVGNISTGTKVLAYNILNYNIKLIEM